MDINKVGLSHRDTILKRLFDISLSFTGLLCTGWLIFLAFVLASIDTKQNGFFTQLRVGRYGKIFRVVKIRTMKHDFGLTTTVTTDGDPRITRLGRFFRKTKIDELPQLINVIFGQMSFVGPRPDVPGFADQLKDDDRIILSVRPGITGPATLKYRDEEQLLQGQDDPERFNREIIFPDKVRINKEYVHNYSLKNDIRCLLNTVFGEHK